MENNEIALHWSIYKHISSLIKGGHMQNESLEVSLQCLDEAFGISSLSEDVKSKLDNSCPFTLNEIFSEGLSSLAEKAPNSKKEFFSNAEKEVLADYPGLAEDKKFHQFLLKIRSLPLFKDGDVESNEHKEKFLKATEKFVKQYRPDLLKPTTTTTTTATSSSITTEESTTVVTPTSTPVTSQPEVVTPTLTEEEIDEKVSTLIIEAKETTNPIQCEEIFKKAFQLNPQGKTLQELYRERGMLRLSQGATELGIDDLNESLKRKPKDLKGLVKLGTSYQSLKKYAQAVEAFDKALELDEGNDVISSKRDACANLAKQQSTSATTTSSSSGAGRSPFGGMAGMPGGMGGMPGGMGGMPGGMGGLDFNSIAAMMNNPQVSAMAQQMMSNPQMMSAVENIAKNFPETQESGNPPSMENMFQSLMSNPELLGSMMGAVSQMQGAQQQQQNSDDLD